MDLRTKQAGITPQFLARMPHTVYIYKLLHLYVIRDHADVSGLTIDLPQPSGCARSSASVTSFFFATLNRRDRGVVYHEWQSCTIDWCSCLGSPPSAWGMFCSSHTYLQKKKMTRSLIMQQPFPLLHSQKKRPPRFSFCYHYGNERLRSAVCSLIS